MSWRNEFSGWSVCPLVLDPYVLGCQVMAQRVPRLHGVLDYGEEAMAGMQLLLEWHSLRTHGGPRDQSPQLLLCLSQWPVAAISGALRCGLSESHSALP
jgi:hypothetical protein